VDWQARDRALVENIRKIALRDSKSLTRGELLAELGIGNMLLRNPAELKRTREEIQKTCCGHSRCSISEAVGIHKPSSDLVHRLEHVCAMCPF
jgi:hypothetical protein